MKSGIYKITNLVNQKVYIGQSKDVKQRLRKHKEMLKNNRHSNEHLQLSYNKYGIENFTFEKIVNCPVEDMDELERFYISKYESIKRSKGYNIQEGGSERHGCPEETRIKISQKNKGQKRPWSEEHKKNASLNWHNCHKPIEHEKFMESIRKRQENLSQNGEKNGNAIITDKQAEEIIIMLINGANPYRLAEELNISRNIILHLYYNKSYKHILPDVRVELAVKYQNDFENKIEKAIDLYNLGLSQNTISQMLHMSRNTIRRELEYRNIDLNQNNPFRKQVNV